MRGLYAVHRICSHPICCWWCTLTGTAGVQVGHRLLSVAGETTEGMTIAALGAALKAAPRPVELVFHVPGNVTELPLLLTTPRLPATCASVCVCCFHSAGATAACAIQLGQAALDNRFPCGRLSLLVQVAGCQQPCCGGRHTSQPCSNSEEPHSGNSQEH